MCLARGGVGDVGGEWVTGLGLGFTNSGGTWGEWDMCLCFGCGGVGREGVGGLCQGLGGWGGVLSVCVISLDYLCVFFHSSTYISLDVGWRNSSQQVQIFCIGWLQASSDGSACTV